MDERFDLLHAKYFADRRNGGADDAFDLLDALAVQRHPDSIQRRQHSPPANDFRNGDSRFAAGGTQHDGVSMLPIAPAPMTVTAALDARARRTVAEWCNRRRRVLLVANPDDALHFCPVERRDSIAAASLAPGHRGGSSIVLLVGFASHHGLDARHD